MKYTVIGIQHKFGTFTPTAGKDAGTEKENIGGMEVVPVRCTPDMYGQLVAECGGHPEDVLNRKIDFDTKELYKVTHLKDFEVVE